MRNNETLLKYIFVRRHKNFTSNFYLYLILYETILILFFKKLNFYSVNNIILR